MMSKKADLVGFEPTTSGLNYHRSPDCATGPRQRVRVTMISLAVYTVIDTYSDRYIQRQIHTVILFTYLRPEWLHYLTTGIWTDQPYVRIHSRNPLVDIKDSRTENYQLIRFGVSLPQPFNRYITIYLTEVIYIYMYIFATQSNRGNYMHEKQFQ